MDSLSEDITQEESQALAITIQHFNGSFNTLQKYSGSGLPKQDQRNNRAVYELQHEFFLELLRRFIPVRLQQNPNVRGFNVGSHTRSVRHLK